jgi:diacylglycerol kinase family enzyme
LNSSPAKSTPTADANQVLIVVNPKAGAGAGRDHVKRLVAALGRHRLSATVITSLPEIATRAVEEHSAGKLKAVVGAGGDGTIAELINRLPPLIPLTMLPLGTENLLAKYVDMPRNPEEVAEVIAAGVIVQQDAGRAGDRLFALMASCGFDAEVVRRLHENRAGHISHWSYFKPIWESIRSYEYPELRIYWDVAEDGGAGRDRDRPNPIIARHAFVFNIPRYAFGFQFTPQAVGDDGLLDVCTFRRGSFHLGLWYLTNVIAGRHRRLADCSLLRAERVRIEADVPVPYNLDGDHCGFLPLEMEIVPRRLTLLVPPGWAERKSKQEAGGRRQ